METAAINARRITSGLEMSAPRLVLPLLGKTTQIGYAKLVLHFARNVPHCQVVLLANRDLFCWEKNVSHLVLKDTGETLTITNANNVYQTARTVMLLTNVPYAAPHTTGMGPHALRHVAWDTIRMMTQEHVSRASIIVNLARMGFLALCVQLIITGLKVNAQ